MIKLIVSDLDGTLLNEQQKISSYNLEAIEYARKNGAEFMIATGRNYVTVEPLIKEYALNCSCMLLNGAEFRDSCGKIRKKTVIPYSIGKNLLEYLKEKSLYADIMDSEGFYTIYEKEEALINMRGRMNCLRPELRGEALEEFMMNSIFYKKLHFIQGFEQLQKEGIELTKLIVFHEHPEYIREIKEELEAKFPELSCTSSFPTNIEINIKNAKKGVALAEYIKELGIQRDEVMVFGDGLNDYSMFEEFSHSYAPSNAMDEIKEIASEVVESNREDGVGKTIYRKMTNF